MPRLSRLAIVCSLACTPVAIQAGQATDTSAAKVGIGQPAGASLPSASALLTEGWRRRTQFDLAAFADALRQNYIYAAYPNPAHWRAWFDRTLATVMAGLPLVHDEAGYQALLTHLAATMQDAHVSIRFSPSQPIPMNWPDFIARFDNGTYRIAASQQSSIIDGAEVSSCDGKPMSWWVATITQYEIGLPATRETTRNDAALHLFADRGSPLRPRQANCTIGGRLMMLNWTPAPSREIIRPSRCGGAVALRRSALCLSVAAEPG